jgi:hypothetical protein
MVMGWLVRWFQLSRFFTCPSDTQRSHIMPSSIQVACIVCFASLSIDSRIVTLLCNHRTWAGHEAT